MEQSTAPKKVVDIQVGDLVDLESCEYLKGHQSASFMFATVESVEQETPACVLIGYEGIDAVGYPTGTVLKVKT